MRVEVELSPVIATGELLELAQLVDEAGADRLDISDVAMLRDTFLVQALCAQATNRVQIGSLVSNPIPSAIRPRWCGDAVDPERSVPGAGLPGHRGRRRIVGTGN